jgi:hypothetical protein
MIDQQALAGIGSMAELRECRRAVAWCAAQRRAQLDRRRQQLTARITPTYILGYVASRTESVLGLFAIARQIYSIARSTIARMKKG